ncbi:hypothetical protein BKA70DRAFT_1297406 [Coprinopsis sp. MPI-PUGE-AT-0042]|nr:hypothetical protein BKA70DRAFT_1297406 [Coprinopsis sp. MPI-PUGE-AT-0042]
MNSTKLLALEGDLANATTVSFSAMLKAICARMESVTSRTQKKYTSSNTEEHIKILTESAVDFCNGGTEHALQLKGSVRDALAQTDPQERIDLFISGLNATLLAYSGKSLGKLTHTPSKGDLIFVANKYKSATGYQRTTIAGTTLQELVDHSPSGGYYKRTSLQHWVKRLGTKTWKRTNGFCHIPWRRLWTCLDVACVDGPSSTHFPVFSLPAATGPTFPPSPYLPSRKRKRLDICDTPSPKRRKVDTTHSVDLSPDVQYDSACNGVEILCSAWDRTHSISFTLQDNWLDLKWYDPQGCIATEPINIVTQLPLLVMVVVLLQRFSPQMQGRASLDLAVTTEGARIPFDIPENSRPRWELKGRHGVTTSLVRKGTKSLVRSSSSGLTTRARCRADAEAAKMASLEDLFFKLSWRDARRPSEGHVISTAKERAQHYLPDPRQVTEHLPDVLMHEDYDELSTCHIRQSLGLSTLDSRTPSIMVMRKLSSLDTVAPVHFQNFIWQIIRCLHLLWQIGITHGDVSFGNMMHTPGIEGTPKGVLIDFDHAAIMEPGTETPSNPEVERFGTLPFISMDMGYKVDTPFLRFFRHDLESLVWTMVWYCQEQPTWLRGSYGEVCGLKLGWYHRHHELQTPPEDVREGAEELWKPILDIMADWMQAEFTIHQFPKTDKQWVEIIDRHLKCPPEMGDTCE